MIDYYLKFGNEAAMQSALEGAGCYDDKGDLITSTFDYALDVIGAIENVSGFHVNWRQLQGEFPSALSSFVLDPPPATPARIWA
jgi:hypothetical protein